MQNSWIVFFSFHYRLQSSLLSQLQDDLNKSLHETIQKEVSGVLAEQSILSNDGRSQSQQRNTQVHLQTLLDFSYFKIFFDNLWSFSS